MKKLIVSLLAGVLAIGMTACSTNEGVSGVNVDMTGEYPVKTNATLTYWMPLDSNLTTSVSNFGETEYAKELEKRTGIKVEYIHPAAGQQTESLSVMIAADELPDIVQSDWLGGYSGGPAKAIDDGVIISLNEYLDEYAPALSKVLKDNPEAAKSVRTDNGDYYVFPMLKLDDKLRSSEGPVIRADWLREYGLEEPETIDEWENVLRVLKEKKNLSAPMSFNYSSMIYKFVNMFEINLGQYLEDGVVKYGPMQPDYKEGVARMHKWYEEGLLDKNIAAVDAKMIDSNILNENTAATLITGGSGIGKYMSSTGIDGFDLVAVKMPSKVKGENSSQNFLGASYNRSASVAISARCKNPELAVKFLDYLYTEEGSMYANFGTEGLTYEMEDGYPKYTDLITKNPDGKSMSQVMPLYFRSSTNGPFVQDVRYIEQYYALPQQQHALEVWPLKNEDCNIDSVPSLTPSAAEYDEYSNIMVNVNKYSQEMLIKFITGVEPLENFDAYTEKLKTLKVERAMEIQQAAYERYEKR